MDIIARYISDKDKTQTILNHSENAAVLCSKTMKKAGLGILGYLTGLIHDMGKASPEFQEYIRKNDSSARGTVHHAQTGALYIYRNFYTSAADVIEQYTAQLIIDAVYSHHTGLFDCITVDAENGFLNKMNTTDNFYQKAAEIFFETVISENKIKELYKKAVAEVRDFIAKMKPFNAFSCEMLQKLLFSALVDSDRYDAYCFEADIDPLLAEPIDWSEAVNKMEAKAASFSPNTTLNKIRCEVSQKCCDFSDNKGIYRLNVPTGGGKTLSSLRFALHHAQKHNCGHIYYVIPYTTILDQTADAIREICGDDMVLEHHSAFINDDDEKYSLYTQRWNAPVILTTVVQLLNSIYKRKPGCQRRMNALCNSVIIIDEVQAVPIKTLSLFNEAINFLHKVCGSTIILCTATMPQSNESEHPIKLSVPPDIVPYSSETDGALKRVKAINLSDKSMNYEKIAEFVNERLIRNPSVLLVFNTTKTARAVYDSINSDCRKILLTTKLCRAHRDKLIKEIKERTQKLNNKANIDSAEKLVVISTQLIEAGVDLSFSCAVRALAGIDSLIQTAGRCNREGEFNGLREVYLIRAEGENLSSLPEIAKAKECTEAVMSRRKNIDLLSREAIEAYYNEYLKVPTSNLSEFDYVVKLPKEDSLVCLLSKNEFSIESHTARPLPFLKQAFAAAGDNFSVIGSETYSVLVPYEDGAEIINNLNGRSEISQKTKLLRKSYAYSVSLYENEIRQLKDSGGIFIIEDTGTFVLNRRFYDENYGVYMNPDLEF